MAMKANSRIFVAGHNGLAGGSIVKELKQQGYTNIVVRNRNELDLEDAQATRDFFASEAPDIVFLAAAKVGGIHANNSFPVEFLSSNLLIAVNVCQAAHAAGVNRLLFLGSSCIYPRECPQPIKEEYLLTGPLEATNRPYALAKIAGIELCWSYNRQYGANWLAVMPTNLYGPGDNYDLDKSHVLPALIRKIHEAKLSGNNSVVLWGSGSPKREFLYVDDLSAALVFLASMEDKAFHDLVAPSQCPVINVGTGTDLRIRELAVMIAGVVGYKGDFVYDSSKPDGTMQKVLEVSKMKGLGWTPKVRLDAGIRLAYQAFLDRGTGPKDAINNK